MQEKPLQDKKKAYLNHDEKIIVLFQTPPEIGLDGWIHFCPFMDIIQNRTHVC